MAAAYKGGSRDIDESWSHVEGYTKTLQEKFGVKIVDSVEALCKEVDVVLLESIDGRPHLDEVRPVIAAGKPALMTISSLLFLRSSNRMAK